MESAAFDDLVASESFVIFGHDRHLREPTDAQRAANQMSKQGHQALRRSSCASGTSYYAILQASWMAAQLDVVLS